MEIAMNNKRVTLIAIISLLVLILSPVLSLSASAADIVSVQTGETEASSGVVYLAGDVDGNGTVNIRDVTILQLTLVGAIEETSAYTLNSNVIKDKVINIRDATVIQMYLVGKYRKLPITPDGYYADVVRP